jgi:hypothetical protein
VPGQVAHATGNNGASSAGCIAHRFYYDESTADIEYTPGCSGHDEPELNPLSSASQSAQNFTWTVVLPSDGSQPVSATGPAFWFGGPVTDPDSLFGQAFLEVQFYPDSTLQKCASNGGFNVTYSPNSYGVCAPVWQVHNNLEDAAFNAMLTDGTSSAPLLMHAGDTVSLHFFVTPAADGWHISVNDQTTGHSGTIVLNSAKHGPLMPAYDADVIGNSLGWGIVHDAPVAFVWEIGHTSPYTTPADRFCLPGDTECDSYDASHWAATTPIAIKSVTFDSGTTASKWAVVSDFGGTAEVNQYCSSYGGPFCIYPWFSQTKSGAFHYGVDYPDTTKDFGQAGQFATTTQCGGPFGDDTTYCDTVLH